MSLIMIKPIAKTISKTNLEGSDISHNKPFVKTIIDLD